MIPTAPDMCWRERRLCCRALQDGGGENRGRDERGKGRGEGPAERRVRGGVLGFGSRFCLDFVWSNLNKIGLNHFLKARQERTVITVHVRVPDPTSSHIGG